MRETLVAWRELVALPGWENLGSGFQFFWGKPGLIHLMIV